MVELLIAITIISTVTVLALPKVREALRSNMLSSAANTVDGALEMARTIAIKSGRPHGVLIERKSPYLYAGTQTGLQPFNAAVYARANYATRISYVQVPADYSMGPKLISFYTLSNQGSNCTGQLRFFAPRADAPLLYAAVDESAPGHLIASRLIGIGSEITIRKSARSAARTSQITNLELVSSSGSNAVAAVFDDYVREYTGAGNGAPCTPRVVKPPVSMKSLEGVVITTRDIAIQNETYGSFAHGKPIHFGHYQELHCQIQLRPTKAALPPVNLPGRSAIDLSMSGWRNNPVAFGVQQIVPSPATQLNASSDNPMHGVIIMFAPDGRMDSVHVDAVDTVTSSPTFGNFIWQRLPPPESVCLLVGTSDAMLEDMDDAASYPTVLPGTAPLPAGPLETQRVPNFANSENTWVTVNSFSGNVQQYPVAEQLDQLHFETFYGLTPTPTTPIRDVAIFRIDNSRRLAFSGIQ
jgi:type II secretory pathway pseudopilin PulG